MWGTGYTQGGLPALLHQSSWGPRGAELATDDDKSDAIRDWAGPEHACVCVCVLKPVRVYACVRWG